MMSAITAFAYTHRPNEEIDPALTGIWPSPATSTDGRCIGKYSSLAFGDLGS